MAAKAISIALILFICFSSGVSSQGYVGTVSTGTGIIPAITVGKSAVSSTEIGAVSTQSNLSGSWSLDLKGSFAGHIDLQINQNGDFIMGSGLLSSEKGTSSVTAAGSMSSNSPTVFICPVDGKEAFRLYLSVSSTSLSGKYDSLSSDGSFASGTVTGSMILIEDDSQVKDLSGSTGSNVSSGAWVGSAAKNTQEDD